MQSPSTNNKFIEKNQENYNEKEYLDNVKNQNNLALEQAAKSNQDDRN